MKRLSCLLALTLAASCAGTPPASGDQPTPDRPEIASRTLLPGWVNDPASHPSYPRGRYLTGVGQAQVEGNRALALDQATENGRKQISEQLNSELEGVTEIYMREVGVNQEYSSATDYVQEIRNKTASLFFGSQQVAQFYDPDAEVMYVLVALEREAHAKALLKKVDTELARATSTAQQSSAAGRLRALIEEHALLEAVMPSLFTLDLVVPRNLSLRQEFDQRYGNAKRRITQVLQEYRDAGVSVRAVSGGGQRGYAGEDLAAPLVFEASMGGRPLVGFPVRFALEHPGRAEIVSASKQTGPDGRLSCRVVGLELTGDEENEVSASLDFASLKERVLAAPGASVAFTLPTLRNSTFSIAIDETNLDRPVPESAVAGRIKDALALREAKVIELDAFLSGKALGEAIHATPTWLTERLGGKVDFLVRGTARTIASSVMNGSHFCYAGGKIELIDVRTGVLVAGHEEQLSSAGAKGAGSTKENGGKAALRKFASLVEEALMGKVDEVFQPR